MLLREMRRINPLYHFQSGDGRMVGNAKNYRYHSMNYYFDNQTNCCSARVISALGAQAVLETTHQKLPGRRPAQSMTSPSLGIVWNTPYWSLPLDLSYYKLLKDIYNYSYGEQISLFIMTDNDNQIHDATSWSIPLFASWLSIRPELVHIASTKWKPGTHGTPVRGWVMSFNDKKLQKEIEKQEKEINNEKSHLIDKIENSPDKPPENRFSQMWSK